VRAGEQCEDSVGASLESLIETRRGEARREASTETSKNVPTGREYRNCPWGSLTACRPDLSMRQRRALLPPKTAHEQAVVGFAPEQRVNFLDFCEIRDYSSRQSERIARYPRPGRVKPRSPVVGGHSDSAIAARRALELKPQRQPK
jgi:hypothetical protein